MASTASWLSLAMLDLILSAAASAFSMVRYRVVVSSILILDVDHGIQNQVRSMFAVAAK